MPAYSQDPDHHLIINCYTLTQGLSIHQTAYEFSSMFFWDILQTS